MSFRSIQSVSTSVLKTLKVFKTFCSTILHYFVKFNFAIYHEQQCFAQLGPNRKKSRDLLQDRATLSQDLRNLKYQESTSSIPHHSF